MRRRWRRGQRKLDAKRLIFIDETAVSTGMTRRGGRSPRGERLICKVPFGPWRTVTLVAALRHDRVTAPMLLEGAMTGESFRIRLCPRRHRSPADQAKASLDPWPGRTHEPHHQGRYRQAVPLRRPRTVQQPPR